MGSSWETKNTLIKRLLNSYRIASENSLSGPSDKKELPRQMVASTFVAEVENYGITRGEPKKEDADRRCALFMTMDTVFSELTSTELEGEIIACFEIGGEKRLCLAQIIKSILSSFTLPEIHAVFESFRIFSAVCSPTQLNCLKQKEIIPLSASKCGLVTKSDAQRFCSVLLRSGTLSNNPSFPASKEPFNRKRLGFFYDQGNVKKSDCFSIVHKCFGGCRGTFVQKLFQSSHSPCIQCNECSLLFSPQKFVSHFHSIAEHKQTCHWGFDCTNWKHYLELDSRELPEHRETLLKITKLDESCKKIPEDQLKEKREGSISFPSTITGLEDFTVNEKIFKCSLPLGRSSQDPPPLLYPQDGNRLGTNEFAPNVCLLPVERVQENIWNYEDLKKEGVTNNYKKDSECYNEEDGEEIGVDDDDDDDDDDAGDDVDTDDDIGYCIPRRNRNRTLSSMSDDDMATIKQFDEIQETESKLFRMALNEQLHETDKTKIFSEFCSVQKKLQSFLEGLLGTNRLLNQKCKDLFMHSRRKSSCASTASDLGRPHSPSSSIGGSTQPRELKRHHLLKKRHHGTMSPVSCSAPVSDPTFFNVPNRYDSNENISEVLNVSQTGHIQSTTSRHRPLKRKRCHTYTSDQLLTKLES